MKSLKNTRLRLKPLDFVLLGVTLALIVFGVTNNLRTKTNNAACTRPGATHEVTVSNDAFTPNNLKLTRCDTVQIINAGRETYDLAFGEHDKHQDYPGFKQQILRPNEFFVLDALQAGTYRMHDHLRDRAIVTFDIRQEIGN